MTATTITNQRDNKNNLLDGGCTFIPKFYHPWGNKESSSEQTEKWGVSGEEAEYNGERLWSLISQNFYKACDEKISKFSRIEAAIDTFYFLSQDMPISRRNATLSRIALAYLEKVVGFDIPATKPNIDLNMQAFFSKQNDFKNDFLASLRDQDGGIFFDPQEKEEAILEWHKSASAAYREMNKNGLIYANLYNRPLSKLKCYCNS